MRIHLKNRNGSALISIVIVCCVLSIIAGAIVAGTLAQTRNAEFQFRQQQALSACNSLQEYAYAYFKRKAPPTQNTLSSPIPISNQFVSTLLADQPCLMNDGGTSPTLVVTQIVESKDEFIDPKNPGNSNEPETDSKIDREYFKVVATVTKRSLKGSPQTLQTIKWQTVK